MKLRCGRYREALAHRRLQRRIAACEKSRQWRRKFAWWPVKMGQHDCRWLEVYEERYVYARPSVVKTPAGYEYVFSEADGAGKYPEVTKEIPEGYATGPRVSRAPTPFHMWSEIATFREVRPLEESQC